MNENGHRRTQRHARFAAPWIVLGGAFLYAVLRYIVFGDTALDQIPLYVTNKALAAGAVVYLLLAGIACAQRRASASRAWGRWALHTAVLHVVISTMLLAAETYPDFFGGERLSMGGEISLLAGVLALYCFVTIGKLAEPLQQRRAFVAGLFIVIHLVFYGIDGWSQPATWQGGLPPVSLLAFLITGGALAAYAVAMRSS